MTIKTNGRVEPDTYLGVENDPYHGVENDPYHWEEIDGQNR